MLRRFEFMQVSDPLSSQLPQLDLMLEALEKEQYDTLFQFYAELDQSLGNLYAAYLEELKYLAVDDPGNAISEKIAEQFENLRPLVGNLRDDLSLNEFGEAGDTLEELKGEAVGLYALFSQYRETTLSGPRYSELPYTHELLRVCHHYLKGDLSLDAVYGRLEVFCQYQENFETQVEALVPSPPEREAFEESREDLEEGLQLQLQGIEDLDHALEINDPEAIREAMELLRESAEVLVEIYHRLQQADLEPDKILCVRCGAENSTGARICGNCSAVLPQSAGAGPGQSTMALEEDGSAVGQEDPEEVQLLQRAVDQALSTGDVQSLREAILRQSKKLDRARMRFEKLEQPPQDIPGDHEALLAEARDVFVQAMVELEAGLVHLNEGAQTLDSIPLEEGMNQIRGAASLFHEFQVKFREAEGLSGG